jgi:hypothetical protein
MAGIKLLLRLGAAERGITFTVVTVVAAVFSKPWRGISRAAQRCHWPDVSDEISKAARDLCNPRIEGR